MNLAIVAILGIGGVSAGIWAGAQLASVVFGDGPLDASLADAATALLDLPSHRTDPAAAWPDPHGDRLPGALAYWTSTAVVTTVSIALIGRAWWLWSTRWRNRTNALGVDRPGALATARDLRHLTVPQPVSGRLTLGTLGRHLIAAEPRTSLAVIGPTGCGKTAGFAIPALLEWRGPIIATSVKNDLLDVTLDHRRQRGRVWIFDPTNITGHPAAGWSPLTGCRTWAGSQRVATWLCEAAQARRDSVTDGDYWYSQARKGLAPYLHAAALDSRTMADVVRWIDTQDTDDVETILRRQAGVDQYLTELQRTPEAHELRRRYTRTVEDQVTAMYRAEHDLLDGSHPWVRLEPAKWPVERQRELKRRIAEQLHAEVDADLLTTALADLTPTGRLDPLLAARALWSKEARLRSSVYATIENVLAGYADPDVTPAIDADQIDIAEWLDGDNTIYVVATAHEQARLRPVLNVLIQQAIRTAYDTATAAGGTLAEPCLVLLDEAGNIAPLRELPGYAATARSHGISLVTIWQDLAQLKSIYGDRAQTVLNNHRAKLFGTGIADDATLDYLSRLIGDERHTELNQSGDLHSGRRSVSEHVSYRRTAPMDTIRRVRTNQALLVYGRELPAQIRLRPWFQP
ncbi:MAG: type IV secretory system conjugative DNA transfer family protein [Acidimicrobiia bacterium]